jgi:hypothetical protein
LPANDLNTTERIARALKFDSDSLQLRKSYVPQFVKAIGAKQTAKFYQWTTD